jgi:hypothetical protein
MPLGAFWEQTFTSALPPARQDGAATLCLHARTKTMLLFACAFRRLIGAFHKVEGNFGLT